MENILHIKERILFIAKNKGFTIEGFCDKIGMTYGNFKGKAKETPINSNTIVNIYAIIPDLNLEWLLTGKGEMLKGETHSTPSNPELFDYLKSEIRELKEENKKLVMEIAKLQVGGK